jgi:hypothetical protein
MVVSSTVWSAGCSQLIVVCCCCSTIRVRASSPLIAGSSVCRAKWCDQFQHSFSSPFIRITRQRV